MYLRCDGNLTFNNAGRPACDSWVLVTEEELLGKFVQQYAMSPEDYGLLSSFIFALFAAAFSARALIQTAKTKEE